MSTMRGTPYYPLGGTIIAIGATTVEQTGMIEGYTYEFQSRDGCALCRWGASDATIADGGFDFAVTPGAVIRAVCPPGTTAINVIESDAGSVATAVLCISIVGPQ